MRQKEFDLFQTAIQWVADEMRITERHGKHTGIWHMQQLWGSGKVLDRIYTAASRYHTQRQWRGVCASGACVAGNIVLLHGDQFIVADHFPEGTEVSVDYCLDSKNTVHSIATRARQLTGLTAEEAGTLFAATNSRATVIKEAKKIATEHGYELEVI